jgi:ABC-type multidrug transport system fused ATPase/permease subunit
MNTSIFFRLLRHTAPYRGLFLLALLGTILIAATSPIRPWLIGDMVNKYIVTEQNPDMLLFWSMVVLALLIFEGFLQFSNAFFSNLLAQSIIRDLRKRLFKHLMSFRIRYFDRTPIGSLVTRVVSDLEAITEVFSSGLMDIAGDLLALIVVICIMFSMNWQLTLLTLAPIPLLLFATRIFARAMHASFQLERQQVNRLNTFVQERLTGMSLVQLFNRQDAEYAQFQEINKGHRQAHINAVWANSIFFPVVELLSSLSIAFLLVYGAVKASGTSKDEIQLMYGEIISFVLYVNMLYRPIRQLADKFNVLQRGTVRAERVFEILDSEEHVQEIKGANDCDFQQHIVFEHLSFAYKDDDFVLTDLNLTIEQGKTVAFVGATGAGKSTIINLLGRFYDYQHGHIRIGQTELKEISLDTVRRHIAVVLQDVFLFSDSIHNNITLWDDSISREEVVAAAKAVGAHDFIMKLPGDYDYDVGERGGVLSVGQRQLIAFIRASVYAPEILVLDEATSSVDDETESLIQLATERLTKGRTSIIVAHRLSTIQNADEIVVLEKGRVIEKGKHAELLLSNGAYKRLYDKQMSERN